MAEPKTVLFKLNYLKANGDIDALQIVEGEDATFDIGEQFVSIVRAGRETLIPLHRVMRIERVAGEPGISWAAS